MFTKYNSVEFFNKTGFTLSGKVDNLPYSVPSKNVTNEYSGAALVMQYLESFINRTVGYYTCNSTDITTLYSNALTITKQKLGNSSLSVPSFASLLEACINLGYVRNCGLSYFNNIATLKWFMREYKQVLIETKKFSTMIPSANTRIGFTLPSTGTEQTETMGFIVQACDQNNVILQTVYGTNQGCVGLFKTTWTVLQNILVKGAVFTVQTPNDGPTLGNYSSSIFEYFKERLDYRNNTLMQNGTVTAQCRNSNSQFVNTTMYKCDFIKSANTSHQTEFVYQPAENTWWDYTKLLSFAQFQKNGTSYGGFGVAINTKTIIGLNHTDSYDATSVKMLGENGSTFTLNGSVTGFRTWFINNIDSLLQEFPELTKDYWYNLYVKTDSNSIAYKTARMFRDLHLWRVSSGSIPKANVATLITNFPTVNGWPGIVLSHHSNICPVITHCPAYAGNLNSFACGQQTGSFLQSLKSPYYPDNLYTTEQMKIDNGELDQQWQPYIDKGYHAPHMWSSSSPVYLCIDNQGNLAIDMLISEMTADENRIMRGHSIMLHQRVIRKYLADTYGDTDSMYNLTTFDSGQGFDYRP